MPNAAYELADAECDATALHCHITNPRPVDIARMAGRERAECIAAFRERLRFERERMFHEDELSDDVKLLIRQRDDLQVRLFAAEIALAAERLANKRTEAE